MPWNRCVAGLELCVLILLINVPSVHAAVGRTPGNFVVSATGAATYTIPIWAPRGPGGVQPNISLVYSSQQGNSTAGIGWSVAGLSSIYRCNLTYGQDGATAPISLSTTDGLCMDGKRLRLTSGTQGAAGSTYQTEIADFSNVTAIGAAGNGPASFSVQALNGWTYEYGNGGNSQVLATGTPNASQWMLDQVTDRAGNTMTVIYTTATGAVVPNKISWTPTGHGATSYNYTMVFGYGPAPPQSSRYGYVAGTAIANTNLLQTITVNYDDSVVKEYFLSYLASSTTSRYQLNQIKECADSAATNCLAPTMLTYQSGAPGLGSPVSLANSNDAGGSVYSAYDFNGDGRTDLTWYDASSGTWWVAFGTSSGYSAPVNTLITNIGYNAVIASVDGSGADDFLFPVSGGAWTYYKWNGTGFTATSTGVNVSTDLTAQLTYTLADLNGDGLPDLVTTGADGYLYVRFNTTNSGTVSFAKTTIKTIPRSGLGIFTGFGASRHLDFFGSGQEDILGIDTQRLIYYDLHLDRKSVV